MLIRILPVFFIALLLLVAVACKSGGGEDSSSNQPAPNGGGQSTSEQGTNGAVSDDELVLSAIEALGRSADDFQEDVQSLRGEMAMDMTLGEVSFGMQGDFAFQSPDRMSMTMEFTGGEGNIVDLSEFGGMEFLVIGEDIYMKMAFLGDSWVKASLDDLGVDADQFREMLSNQSPFDYSALIEELGGDLQAQDLGLEDLEGREVHHFRVSSDFATLMEAMGGTFDDGFTDNGFALDDYAGPVVLDLWLDTATLLPYKLAAKGAFVVDDIATADLGGNMAFSMTMVIHEYNGAVSFPDPPADAIDISELGDEMFTGPEE